MTPFTAADFQLARARHLQFKSRLRAILYDELPDRESKAVLSQYACSVGQWLYGHALIEYENIPEVHELEKVHASIHVVARELIARHQQGHVDDARQGLAAMEQIADQLVDLLRVVEEKIITARADEFTDGPPDDSNLTALLAKNELLDVRIKQRIETAQQGTVILEKERQLLQESQHRLLALFEQSPVGIAILDRNDLTFLMANPFYGYLVGRTPEQLAGRSLLDALPELAGQGVDKQLLDVMATGVPFIANEVALSLVRRGRLETVYLNLTYQPRQEPDNAISGVVVVATDVTQQVVARRRIEDSEARFRSLIDEAPVATCLMVGRELTIDVANNTMLDLWGKSTSVVGKPLADALPELKGQPFLGILDHVFTSGQPYEDRNTPAEIRRNGVLGNYYFDFTYKPLFNAAGEVYAIMNMAIEVTRQVLARQAQEANEAKLQLVVTHAPAAIGLLMGRELRIDLHNQLFTTIVGQGPDLTGKTLGEVMTGAESQFLLPQLDAVFTSGKTFQSLGTQITVMQAGIAVQNYYNFTFTPLFDEQGQVYAILDVSTDVTDEINARKQLQDAEAALQGAIELAKLGTWQVDLSTNILDYSKRLRRWFGLEADEIITAERAYSVIRAEDRGRAKASMLHAIAPGTDGIYDVEYRVNTAAGAPQRILRAQGTAHHNEQGQAYRVSGTVQDVTQQRQLQQALEQQVQQRTEELKTANQALAAANEELTESNGLLIRSNNNLQNFAYVASHDLQEPLRKIQQFGDLLKMQYTSPTDTASQYIDRMQTAASRMSSLIRDLLAFSRLTSQRGVDELVSLAQIVQLAESDLELVIAETGALVQVDPLPTIKGNAAQLGQLFQNLLNNALKFRRAGVSPVVRISSRIVVFKDLAPAVKPVRMASAYHRIDVSDNGIGFDEKYLDRIFQVFQRLHARKEFAGTGIGLAICEKVAVNHGGFINATSKPGQGATFHIYLPTA